MKTNSIGSFEKLESRRYLSITVSVEHGDLIVEGDAVGDVVITAQDDGTFKVTDNFRGSDGSSNIVEGVTDDIRIDLDPDGESDDLVTLNLSEQSVDKVFVKLGDGANQFVLQAGAVNGGLTYEGGDGDDVVQIGVDADVAKSVYARLGDGNNKLVLAGSVGRALTIKAGEGDDEVNIQEGARVDGDVRACLGDGVNKFT